VTDRGGFSHIAKYLNGYTTALKNQSFARLPQNGSEKSQDAQSGSIDSAHGYTPHPLPLRPTHCLLQAQSVRIQPMAPINAR